MSPIYPNKRCRIYARAHGLPNSHKKLRNVLPVPVDIVVVLCGASTQPRPAAAAGTPATSAGSRIGSCVPSAVALVAATTVSDDGEMRGAGVYLLDFGAGQRDFGGLDVLADPFGFSGARNGHDVWGLR